MLISKKWIERFVNISDISAKELSNRLTLSTVEVEGSRSNAVDLENIVVGIVESVERHPNADKLNVCRVSVGGSDTVAIVCGGTNVRKGMKVAVAKIGASVCWHGKGELVKMKSAEIRGVASEGMICASSEIGLADYFPQKDEREILDLTGVTNSTAGVSLSDALKLDDVVLEIDNKSLSNRPDLWGHYGMAREISALFKRRLAPYSPAKIKNGNELKISVRVEDRNLCKRYMVVAISGIKVGPSPLWMQKLLISVGARPVNNIVDITNYVMMETGQPMHAFDINGLRTSDYRLQITVRMAKNGEKLKALDGKEYPLSKDMLVIANTEKPMAIAGIIGGIESSVQNNTTEIVFESATFDAANTRATSSALSLRSESSARFEKSLDPLNAELALRRAVELIIELCNGARAASSVADVFSKKPKPMSIKISLEDINVRVGSSITKKEAQDILKRLGFSVKQSGSNMAVGVPSWRATKDISIQEDIVEEVVRIYGYNKIHSSLPLMAIEPPKQNAIRKLERRIKNLASYECGYSEARNYSFVSRDWLEKCGMDSENLLELQNPIAKDAPFLRESLLPGLLEKAEQNFHRFDSVRMFEIGRVFRAESSGEYADPQKKEWLPAQDLMLGFVCVEKGNDAPFYSVSRVIARLGHRLNVDLQLKPSKIPSLWMHSGRSAEIFAGDSIIGCVSEIHPKIQNALGINARAAVGEISIELLSKFVSERILYEQVPLYPSVIRDIAFVINKNISHNEIMRAIRGLHPLIVSAELFDVYIGKGILDGKKSMAYHIEYRSPDNTLESAGVDAVHAKLENTLRESFGAEIRK